MSLVVKGTGEVSELRALVRLLKRYYIIVEESNLKRCEGTERYHLFLDLEKNEAADFAKDDVIEVAELLKLVEAKKQRRSSDV
jgi:hypothetical protein